MIERHYDDESLISLLDDVRADEHLRGCPPCSEKLDSFRGLASALRESDVWDMRELAPEPVASTVATLRAFATSMQAEDARAEDAIVSLLAGPRDGWIATLREHPEYRTAGMVRKLVERADLAVDTMPPDAVAMTELATEIADHLDPDASSRDAVHRLRGLAWLEKAFALNYTSRFDDALGAADRADANFEQCVVDEYDRARLGIVRTMILEAFDRLDEAAANARASIDTFVRFDDAQRTASASMAEAHVLFRRNRPAEVEANLLDVERRVASVVDGDTHARLMSNLAYAAWRLGNLEESLRRYEIANAIHREHGNISEILRNRWFMTMMLTEAGRIHDACERLSPLTAEMERLGMTLEASVNMLFIAELFLVKGRYAEVEDLCRTAMQAFERSGIVYRDQAMTALAFIREAARQKKATEAMARTVREYIDRLPAEPNLLFAPPPF